MASVDFKTYVDQACRAAEEFVNVYYTTMDKRRRLLSRLYMGTATLVWNGNAVTGQEALNEFFEMLPSSEFQINVVDCQPVHDEATPSQTTVLVVICGSVKFEGNKQRDFNQNFILTAQASPTNTVWKIASDCFRFQDWASYSDEDMALASRILIFNYRDQHSGKGGTDTCMWLSDLPNI
ncbi:hypothetical protein U0070_025227 [Myodes glareolus]|uniref:NTF2 domain-containing protein n=2 Tax=Myodes glareolus TaxID=447135 RepID=A0AAW0IN05_MYOGA